jgi:hypothetical protein
MLAPEIQKFLRKIRAYLKGKEVEEPIDQDHLEAYPERMQISAIPERRYLRTARLLAILTFINIGVLIALAGVFSYYALRIDISVANRRAVNLYAIDPEHKVIKAAEYGTKVVPAMQLMMEKAVREFIIARNSYRLDPQEHNKNWGPGGKVAMYLHPEMYKSFIQEHSFGIANDAQKKKVNKEVHIYSLQQTPAGLWEGLIDVFDMPPYDPFNPLCQCMDNSQECLTCKEKHMKGKARYKVYVDSGFNGFPSLMNPLGVMVDGFYIMPKIIHPNEKYWDIPAILKPEL